jgi:hypothetical protein
MKNSDEAFDDFTEEEWESIRRDHQALEAFQSSHLHLKAKARLREILSFATPSKDSSSEPEKNFTQG